MEGKMSENDKIDHQKVLDQLLKDLGSHDPSVRKQAIATIHTLSYSSEAIRAQLEKLAVHDLDVDVRKNALSALSLPAQRNVQSRVMQIAPNGRQLILGEVGNWERNGLIPWQTAEVLRRRYDFDHAPRKAPEPIVPDAQPAAAPKVEPKPQPQPEGPRPSLLQSLLSEASIKIYLYLGAFFVIASAAIIGAVIPELRLPILVIGTLIFGGLSIAIKKRLPQPSFALFIVFSFLLPITANTIQETIIQGINVTPSFNAGYWAVVYFIMAAIWAGSTWFYESRLFSITAFISLTLAFIRIGNIFDARAEFHALMIGLDAILGLAGTWFLKKWRDQNFALPLFVTSQVLQAINLLISLSIFGSGVFDPSNQPLWHLVTFLAWVFALAFYLLADRLFPFVLFPWLAAGTLIPLPWFLSAAFDLESLGSTVVLFIWGAILSILSEFLHRAEAVRKFSLPVLLASMAGLGVSIITAFAQGAALGTIVASGIAVIFTGLHILRTRTWLWTLALLHFTIAWFAFFTLEFMRPLDVFIGYQTVGISILFLLPDLFLGRDWLANPEWRFPLRLYGAAMVLSSSFILPSLGDNGQAAIGFAAYTLFLTAYVFVQRKPILAYLPTAYLPLTIIFALQRFDIDAWLPMLTGLAVLYYIAGSFIHSSQKWSVVFRNSALVLGTLTALSALLTLKETGGWYALIIGILFAAEMYLSRDGWFEIGMPIMFNAGTFLILRDFNVNEPAWHLLAYSLVWLLTDLLAHLTFTNPRPLSLIVRGIGAMLTLINYGILFFGNDTLNAVIGFGIYSLLFLVISLVYRKPFLLYTFTSAVPLFIAFLSRDFGITKWNHPVIFVAMVCYAVGFILRSMKRAAGWDEVLLHSGLGLGMIASFASPGIGGLDAAIPVAIAATLWAVEAFAKKNAWLAMPANGLYLLAYFIILFELNVEEPQFFSMGAALLGMIQHYLLVRAGSKTGAFIMGMLSQFVLLGTTYIEMVNKSEFIYLLVLFLQAIAVLTYGIVIRSRSLTFFPIGFVVIGVLTVVNGLLEGVGAIFLIGCAGIILLILGVFAVLMRERISKFSERLSDWKA
jgi:hypothetical protein